MVFVLLVIIIFNFKIFLFQFRRDFCALHKPILIKFIAVGSHFPEVRDFGTLNKSTKVFRFIICKKL